MEENELIPLKYDKNGFLQYWINTADPIWGYSLWTYESKKETNCSKLVINIPKRFMKHFTGIEISKKYYQVLKRR